MKMDFSSLNVMGIDDTETARKLMFAALKTLGIQKITMASSLEQSWPLVFSVQPDIIITDHYLGDGTGLDLAQRIRNLPADGTQNINPLLPIVLLTARPTIDILETAKKTNISAMLAKPFSPDILGQRIKTAMTRGNQQAAMTA